MRGSSAEHDGAGRWRTLSEAELSVGVPLVGGLARPRGGPRGRRHGTRLTMATCLEDADLSSPYGWRATATGRLTHSPRRRAITAICAKETLDD